jgi:hypothetical protein
MGGAGGVGGTMLAYRPGSVAAVLGAAGASGQIRALRS